MWLIVSEVTAVSVYIYRGVSNRSGEPLLPIKGSPPPCSRSIFQLVTANIYSASAATSGEFVVHFFLQ